MRRRLGIMLGRALVCEGEGGLAESFDVVEVWLGIDSMAIWRLG
jgi:hypothetical protein